MSKFYGIGVGPGDEELLTLKAVNVLKTLDVLLIPATKKGKKGVAHTIAEKYLKKKLEVKYINFPMVVDEKVFEKAGQAAAEIIIEVVNNNQNIGFITLGDPGVYSTYGYIVAALNGAVEIETIPGITSFCAAAAMANRPLVQKDEILSIIPMNAKDEQIDNVLADGDTFVFMKVYKREKRVIDLLKKHHLDEQGVLALRCGFDEAEVKEDVIQGLKENTDYLSIVHTRK